MKIVSYNILAGGRKRIGLIIDILAKLKPDFLALLEASGFTKYINSKLEYFSRKLNLPFYEISPSAKYDFPVVSLSRYQFKTVQKIPFLQNSALMVTLASKYGEITFANMHPHPEDELTRLKDIDTIFNHLLNSDRTILMGDMNALSPQDDYPDELIDQFNDKYIKKFTINGQLATMCVQKIIKRGFFDAAVLHNKNHIPTAPTGINLNEAYAIEFNQPQVRIDYIFTSSNLKHVIKKYDVLNTDQTRRASDHFPVLVELELLKP